MKNILIIISSILIIGCTTNRSTGQAVNKWDKLGTKKVNYRLDKDVIKVGVRDGLFTKLKVVVTNGALNMHKMVVVYKNGQRDNINLRHQFSKKSDSRVIDLKGGKRVIKEIIFWYDTKNVSRRKAQVTVFGRH